MAYMADISFPSFNFKSASLDFWYSDSLLEKAPPTSAVSLHPEGWDSCDREELSLLPCSMCDPGQASGHWLTGQAARSLSGLDGQVGGKGSLMSGKSEAWAAWRWVLVILVLW